MSPSEFLTLADATLLSIEQALESYAEDLDWDIERSGYVLTVTLANQSKIIINSQEPMQELWLAAKAGGFHFQRQTDHWRDTRTGQDLYTVLSQCLSTQAEQTIVLREHQASK